jgi:predicted transposase YbfD/YdcC
MTLPLVFENLTDPRASNARHPFTSILFIALCATIAQADTFEDIEQWGKAQHHWLQQRIPLPHGIPCADTFLRLFNAIDPRCLHEGFVCWTRSIATKTGGEVIAIDGKSVKASADRCAGISALHQVSAWASTNRLVLAQESVGNKENEIVAIPRLLEMLDLSGCIVTIDAMGCQKDIAQQIISSKGDYILSLKDNHPILFSRIKDLFDTERSRDFVTECGDAVSHSYHHDISYDHGRVEHRRCWLIPDVTYLDVVDSDGNCFGFRSVVCIDHEFHSVGKITKETRYYISTLSVDAGVVLQARRSHWGIENSVHWVLDVVFNEDRCRVSSARAGENLGILRHVVLNLIRRCSLKGSLGVRRKLAAWNTENLLVVLQA